MTYKKNSSESFTGGSGQMVVMGELLHRKCNAAIPVVDVGTDVFAFLEDREEVARIQVKTATGKPYKNKNGYSADFRIPIEQLERTDSPSLFYALVVRLREGWGNILVIARTRLQELREEGVGSEIANKASNKLYLRMYIQFRLEQESGVEGEQKMKALCGDSDLTAYLNAWESLPPLKPVVAIESPTGGGSGVR